MKKLTVIEAKQPLIKKRKRVAAYCRISLETERMNNSMSNQISYFSQLIQSNPEWEYAGVYTDNGITGTSISKRKGFQQMIADCDAGQIDIILTKSIQRFARNTVDLLETVRHLRNLGIEVRFEKENINSLSGDGELMLSILASFAQEESRSISENLKWSKRNGYKEGKPNCHFNVYGYRWHGDELLPDPDEAPVVKQIFSLYLQDLNKSEIGRRLNSQGLSTRDGYPWTGFNIGDILQNSIYTGELVMQKQFTPEGKVRHFKPNRGELPQYVIPDHHEALVSRDAFDKVQEIRKEKAELGVFANDAINTSVLTRKIKCSRCGDVFFRGVRKNKSGEKRWYWGCASLKRRNTKSCGMPTILERTLFPIINKVLETETFDADLFETSIDFIEVQEEYRLIFHFKDGQTETRDWKPFSHKELWTPERRAAHSQAMKDCWTDEMRKAAGERFRQRNKDPEFREKIYSAKAANRLK